MCGIIGYAGRAQAAPLLISGLHRLEYRGYDSAGVAVSEDAGVRIVKCLGRVAALEEKLGRLPPLCGCCGAAHTRWATHGAPDEINAHPHRSPDGSVVMVHNGVIENHLALRGELTRRGFSFSSQTDTEAAAILLADLYGKSSQSDRKKAAFEAMRQMCAQIEGSYAMVVLFADQPDALYAVRQGSPLVVGRCAGKIEGYLAASDVQAVLAHTRDMYIPPDGYILRLSRDALTVIDEANQPITPHFAPVRGEAAAAEKGDFPHFMLKEIAEQPSAVRAALDACKEFSDDLLRRPKRLLLCGCGSAYHAALIGAGVIERLCGMPCRCAIASECRDVPIEDDTLAVFVSQSGETADTVAAMRAMRSRGLPALAIVNAEHSTLAREADAVIHTRSGPEISVATTKAFIAQATVFFSLAVRMSELRGAIDDARRRSLLAALASFDECVAQALACRDQIQQIAARIAGAKSAFFIGRGLDAALCMEGALKLKEISYIHAEAFPAGELKHGTISLIERGTPVVALTTQPHLLSKMRSAMAEVKSRGANVIAVASMRMALEDGDADAIIRVPDTDPLFSAAAAAPTLQLLAYETCLARGLDPDRPRSLAKSVTVE